MHPCDINVSTANIDKYKNWLDDQQSLCLADFTSSCVGKKASDVSIELHDIRSYTVSVSNIDNVEPNRNVIVSKNELGEMQKHSQPCVICNLYYLYKGSELKSPEEHHLRLSKLHMP